jgi:hypothetical protein
LSCKIAWTAVSVIGETFQKKKKKKKKKRKKKKKTDVLVSFSASPLKFSSDLDFVVPANFVSRDEFAATMLAEFLSDAVVFKVIDLKTRKTATISCCREGLIIMDKSTLRAFHHFRSIANFVAPPAGEKFFFPPVPSL